jgi:hypothetical protein
MNDVQRLLGDNIFKRHEVHIRLVEFCRHLEPQLRDLKANHSADRLMSLLGEIDVLDAEIHEMVIQGLIRPA